MTNQPLLPKQPYLKTHILVSLFIPLGFFSLPNLDNLFEPLMKHLNLQNIEVSQNHLTIQTEPFESLETTLTINLPDPPIIPGSMFYQPKIFLENLRLNLARTTNEKLKIMLNSSEQRLAETLKLIQNKNLELAQKTFDEHFKIIQKVAILQQSNTNQPVTQLRIENQIEKSTLINLLSGEYNKQWSR